MTFDGFIGLCVVGVVFFFIGMLIGNNKGLKGSPIWPNKVKK